MNLLTICDDLDEKQGEYFAASYEDLLNKLESANITHRRSLNTNECLENLIDFYTPDFNGQPFIFIAYAHGSETSICISGEDYIHTQNAYLFNKALFYACCCLSAKSLGQHLVDNGCTIFLGFDAPITSCNPETEGIYQDCENTFITLFLNTESTIAECLSKTNEKYQNMVNFLLENYGFNEASILDRNFNAFQLLCSEDVQNFTRHNFI